MLKIDEQVARGILFLRFSGNINSDYNIFEKEINYLLYEQGIKYYVFDFEDIDIEEDTISKLKNKLVEIFLTCGEVALCGLDENTKSKIGKAKNKLYYVNEEREAFKYLWM